MYLVIINIILYYLKQTQHEKLEHILNIKRIDRNDYVWMDHFTILNLVDIYDYILDIPYTTQLLGLNSIGFSLPYLRYR